MINRHLLITSNSGGLTFVFCLLSVIILPVHVDYLPPVMIMWVGCWILENHRRFHEIWNIEKPSVLLFAGFTLYFLWYLAGLLYSNDFNNGILLIFRRLSFIIFPLVLFFPGDMIKKRIRLLLKIYSISTLLYVFFCFSVAFYRSVSFENGNFVFNPHPPQYDYENYFFGTDLVFSQHTSYFAMYVLFSIFIAFEFFFENLIKSIWRISWLLSGIILLGSLYFISSRAGIISALILTPLYFLYKLRKNKHKWISFLTIILISLVLSTSFMNNERLRCYLPDNSGNSIKEKLVSDVRIPMWKSAVSVIKQNLLFGVGVGDASDELKDEFKKEGYSEGYYENLNAHNQYLEVLLGTGLIGFLVLVSILMFMIYMAISKRNLLYGIFLLIVMIFFMFESILNRIAGVTFFSLFSFLLLHLDSGKNQTLQSVDNSQ